MKFIHILPGAVWLSTVIAVTAASTDPLETGFQSPPDSAKPQTWWHWMNGNITKEGITADLDAMKQIGLSGATIVNVDCGIPHGDAPFMSPQWRDDFKFAVSEADRLGLQLCVENCAGWSSSGGPWNTPTNAMQRLTSSEIQAQGPSLFDDLLPQPPLNLGYYRDIAVIAFPAPPAASAETDQSPTPGKLEIKHAVYGPEDGGSSRDVTAELAAAVEQGKPSITVNNDSMGGDPAFGEVKQLRVELTLDGKPATISTEEGDVFVLPYTAAELTIARLSAGSGLNRTFVQPPPVTLPAPSQAISHDSIIELTGKLGPDGRLKWQVPPGKWTIIRLGYTPIGVHNHPAPPEGDGLECDKLSKSALDEHWNGFMQKVLDDIGPLAGKALNCSLIDSYEVGPQDWSKNFRHDFKRLRGYDPVKYLACYDHYIVDDPAVTARFLWDMRRTVADLFAENYYQHFAELCHQHGLKNAIEPYTGPFESIQCGEPADIVMGEFWTGSQGDPSVKLAASIAHIYGKTIVGAESFTAGGDNGRWQNDPYGLKTLGDLMYSRGLNRYIFHRYAMQPWTNRWPGMTMGEFGFHFERTETWWQQGRAWIDYISHCEFLLQQGHAIADAAYFCGDSAPVEIREGNPKLPEGYDFDAVNADVLRHGATVKNHRLTLASGANYAVLVLPPEDVNLTPETLKSLRKLVHAGATIVGAPPQHSPSLADYPRCDVKIKEMVDDLWGPCDGVNVQEHACGKGRVVWGKSLVDVFDEQNLKPDFAYQGASAATHLVYAHRVAGSADIYFVSNQRRQFDSVNCTFRVAGKVPELWHPDTGVIETAPVWSAANGRTTVKLDFDPAGSVFVVFRHADNQANHWVAASGTMTAPDISSAKVEIQHAVYGGLDGTNEMDVTEQLSHLVQDGQSAIAANNSTFGHDPAIDQRKELQVDYTIAGSPRHVIVPENGIFKLSATQSIGDAPLWELQIAADGQPEVKLWGDGQVNLTTASGKAVHVSADNLPADEEISGAWNLSFPPNWGAPPSVTLDNLISWTDDENDGVRYFSGTATYEKEINIPSERFAPGREVWLDLGLVKNFAEVSLNGHDFGVLWKPPFRVNLTSAAKPGVNQLKVKVTNLWPNRLIGDEQLPPDREWDGNQLAGWPKWLLEGKPSPTGRFTFTTWHHWKKDAPLLESGLLGPVQLESAQVEPAQ